MERNNFTSLKQKIDFGKLKRSQHLLGETFTIESILGNIIKLISILGLIGITVHAFSQGEIVFLTLIDLQTYSSNSLIFSGFASSLCYSFYLNRDKDKFQNSLGNSDLIAVKEQLEKNEEMKINTEDYLSRSFAQIVAKALNLENSQLLYILKESAKSPMGKIVLRRLGIDEKELDLMIQKYSQLKFIDTNAYLDKVIKHSCLTALETGDQFINEMHYLLSIFKYEIPEILLSFNVKRETVNSVITWLNTQNSRHNLIELVKSRSLLRKNASTNRAMTSIKSSTVEEYGNDITYSIVKKVKRNPEGIKISSRKATVNTCLAELAEEGGLVMIVGEPGSGKSTIIDTIAISLISEKVPTELRDTRLIELNISKLLSDTSDSTNISELLQKIFTETERSKNIILVIDDFEQLLKIRTELRTEIESILAAELANIEVRLIATTTQANYQRYLEPKPDISTQFETVELPSLETETIEQILLDEINTNPDINSNIEIQAVREIIDKSDLVATDSAQPKKSIDILKQISKFAKRKKLEFITKDIVERYFENVSGFKIPSRNTQEAKIKEDVEATLESQLRSEVVGQDEAVQAVARALIRAKAGLSPENKPLASFLFFGPTGVGKTHLTQTIAKQFLAKKELFLRLDMSSFQEEKNLERLLGSSSNGSSNPGVLTEFVHKHPFSVILLDELEKANPKVLDLFLQILDNAQIKDGLGRTINFSNTIIVATSNVGSNLIAKLTQEHKSYKQIKKRALEKLEDNFRIEFLNRFDEIIMFRHLTKINAKEICRKLLFEEQEKLAEKGIEFVFSDDLVSTLVEKGYSEKYGARELKRSIKQEVEDKVANALVSGKLKSGDMFSLE
jgi:ATP-dependent Clp protease ATP-binding subunit ClpC